MKSRHQGLVLALALAAMTPLHARNDQNTYALQDALNTPAAQQKLDPAIRLYFGDQPHARPTKTLGEWKTNKKTNAVNKSDQEACEWVFLSAALELQERAHREGGNAVINIKSNLNNIERSSGTQYQCANGTLMAGVALKGTVVQLPR